MLSNIERYGQANVRKRATAKPHRRIPNTAQHYRKNDDLPLSLNFAVARYQLRNHTSDIQHVGSEVRRIFGQWIVGVKIDLFSNSFQPVSPNQASDTAMHRIPTFLKLLHTLRSVEISWWDISIFTSLFLRGGASKDASFC